MKVLQVEVDFGQFTSYELAEKFREFLRGIEPNADISIKGTHEDNVAYTCGRRRASTTRDFKQA